MYDASALPILLKELRLPTMGHLWKSTVQDAEEKGWSYPKFLTTLCDYEVESRNQKRIQTFLKKGNLPYGKTFSTFDFKEIDKLNKPKVDDLAHNTSWITQGENLLIFGPSGVGKTHLAAAIAHSLIEKGVKVLFTSATSLVQKLQIARKNLSLPMTLSKLDQYALLIIDDIGYVRKDEGETHVLFELIAHRYESASLIVTSNQPFSEWDQIFATNSMTVAAIDRLVHHATILEIHSESYRTKQSLKNHLI